jgi:hypothetical protein
MAMEFKIIVYVLIAIGYFVHNNYKKLVKENSKRVFGQPTADTMPSSIPPVTQPPSKPYKEAMKNPRSVFQKPALPKKDRTVLRKPERNFEIAIPEIPQVVSASAASTSSLLTPIPISTAKNYKGKLPSSQLRSAILYGEIINNPAWSKY